MSNNNMPDEEKMLSSKDYLSPKQIEKKLNLSHSTVSKLMKIKGFPVVRIGRNIRVREDALDAFMDAYVSHTINL